ncbi:MAG: carboxypeptidase-like regulatory domain-containing protein, partial [Candidatus Sulfotelmatobacter sp.]
MIRILIFVSMFLALVSALAFGQGGVATGDLHVTVKDPKGNLVANAVVTVRDSAKGLERSGNGDGQGGYSARLLPPGTYSVTIDAPGFSGILSTGVGITVGGLIELPVTLSVATGREVV